MAIDSTLFQAIIPAGTYAVGDTIPLSVVRGPSVVRDGYGEARLKRIYSIQDGSAIGHVALRNSDWSDEMANIVPAPSYVILANNSNAIQQGHDCILKKNSGWDAKFTFDAAITAAAAFSVFLLVDIDYPSVQAVADPKIAKGTPATTIRADPYTVVAVGASLSWQTINVDILKAGRRYLLASATFRDSNAAHGFFSISSAAGQNGLERIIPVVPSSSTNLRYVLDYSTPLVKGPFNINYAGVGTAGASTALLELDWAMQGA